MPAPGFTKGKGLKSLSCDNGSATSSKDNKRRGSAPSPSQTYQGVRDGASKDKVSDPTAAADTKDADVSITVVVSHGGGK